MTKNIINRLRQGFTMVEILIVMAIISSVTATGVMVMDPKTIIDKAQDRRRDSDMAKISVKLEEYFNDKGCYPTEVPFGDSWMLGTMNYMEVPQDPAYPQHTYYYISGDECPRWYTMFYRNLTANTTEPSCILPTDCQPANYHSLWGCKISGSLNCETVAAMVLPDEPTPTPNFISTLINSLSGSTAAPTSIPATTPTSVSTLAPTSISTLAPTSGGTLPMPTSTIVQIPGAPEKVSLVGKDGTWCYESYRGRLDTPNNEYCQDIYGIHPNSCTGVGSNKINICTGTSLWPVIGFNNVHCSYFTVSCLAGQSCDPEHSRCVPNSEMGSYPTATPGPSFPRTADFIGSDGSWCNDSDDGTYLSTDQYCEDGTKKYYDTCEGQTATENYCSGTWNGSSWSNLHCQKGGYVCPANMYCKIGTCAQITPTKTPAPIPTAIPTSIGSTGVGHT